MKDRDPSVVDRLVALDAQRPGLPGEHALAFALGAYLVLRGRRSSAARLASVVAGGLLIARALSGRDGVLAALRRRAGQDSDAELTEVAAPWPYDQRVRLSTPRRTRRGQRATADAS